MNTKTFGAVLGVLIVTTACLAFMTTMSSFTIAAKTTEQNTSSDANVSYFVAIGMSTELMNGIHFGNVEPDSTENNASQNFNASSMTEYWIAVSPDGNTAVNISIKDNADLTSSLDTITNVGYTYDANLTATDPSIANEVAITTSYVTAISDVENGTDAYFRFWLDVPASTAAGNYNNTVFFQAVKAA